MSFLHALQARGAEWTDLLELNVSRDLDKQKAFYSINDLNILSCRPEFREWTDLLERVVSRELTTRSDPLAFVANADTDTELWVYRNKEERDLVFAFR